MQWMVKKNPLPTFNTMKFYEVQKYLAITNHIVNDQMLLISNNTWKKLTAEQQNIITKVTLLVGKKHTAFVEQQEKELIQLFRKRRHYSNPP